MRLERGFTLLEILAALAIAAVGIAAVAQSTAGALNVLQSSEDRVLASWVASNRLAELRMSRVWPSAITRDASEVLGGRVWYYREHISTTDDPDLLRVDLAVYRDEAQEDLSAELFGYLARYSPATSPPPEVQDSGDEQPAGGNEQNGGNEQGGDGQGAESPPPQAESGQSG